MWGEDILVREMKLFNLISIISIWERKRWELRLSLVIGLRLVDLRSVYNGGLFRKSNGLFFLVFICL